MNCRTFSQNPRTRGKKQLHTLITFHFQLQFGNTDAVFVIQLSYSRFLCQYDALVKALSIYLLQHASSWDDYVVERS